MSKANRKVIPPRGISGKQKYPWGELKEYGDNFFVPAGDLSIQALQQKMSALSVAYCGRRPGMKTTSRREAKPAGVRIYLLSEAADELREVQ